MPQEYNVRFKNASSDDVRYVAVHALAQVQGHLDVNERDDYMGQYRLYEGPRAVTVFSTFPPAIKFSQVINIDSDYFLIKITDAGITTSRGNGSFNG